ncbi:MAG TPA: DUF418 domain-containing protein, partial [Prolixibacteraceae bacterium]|nr:DUF418 domain-containing protein [Prolixibacteraceae bacterium]
PLWMKAVDKVIWDTLFFLFGGKAYEIFALLFGLTFYIQSDNQAKKGKDFRGRFAWRMFLLLLFGIVNSAFYEGDVLTIYALIGYFLLPFAKMGNKTVLIIALFLMLQPYEWGVFFHALQNPDALVGDPKSWAYFGRAWEYIPGNSLIKTWIGNLTNGKTAVLIWTWEEGRAFQTLSLFMLGMLSGRKGLFQQTEKNRKFWLIALLVSALVFIPLFLLKSVIVPGIESAAVRRPLGIIVQAWSNFSFMLVLVSAFTLLFWSKALNKALNVFSPLGRMSLSNYMIQSLVGSFIYYGFGLGLYQYTGATYSLFIGIVLAILQGVFSAWWFKRHHHGPLEWLWHQATWIELKKK